MNYEQKYKESFERAKIWQNHLNESGDKDYADELNYIFPELKESEDERIRRDIIRYLKKTSPAIGENIEKMLAWLEKQGEFYTKRDVDNAYIEGMAFAKDELEKQGEQNPANKVEPKFKVGDWIVNNTTLNLCHIVKVEHGQYICDDCSFPITKENEYHLWTIQDAKDGDVLVTWNNNTFIFKAIEDDVVKYYIAYNEKWDEEIRVPLNNDSHVGLAESQFEFKPATKEQRDTLMKAMNEAGYTFDFEKKEFKKIEQKPTEWSEEDESYLNTTIAYLKDAKEFKKSAENCINWLKSLKGRVQTKQGWKPSNEQMESLFALLPTICSSNPIFSLYEDLKKLKG